MTDKQLQWTFSFTISVVALIVTSHFGYGWGWILGWLLWSGFSIVKLAIHGGLNIEDE